MTIQGKHGSDGVVQTAVRLPLDLRERLRAEAKVAGRSLNTHIVMRLTGNDDTSAGDFAQK